MTTTRLSAKAVQATKAVFERGYRVIHDGQVISPAGRIIKVCSGRASYPHFTFRLPWLPRSCNRYSIFVHQLAAYQLFGDQAFMDGFEVRHKDGDRRNSRLDNFLIGTHSENMRDRDPKVRHAHATLATAHTIRFSPDEVAEIHAERAAGWTYKEIGAKHSVGKGALSYFFNKSKYAHRDRPTGRTPVSGAGNVGSNPAPGTTAPVL